MPYLKPLDTHFKRLDRYVRRLSRFQARRISAALQVFVDQQQLEDDLWAAFVKGTHGHPLNVTPQNAKNIQYLKDALDANVANGNFKKPAFKKNTEDCSERAGEIATSLAKFRKHQKIEVNDLELAYTTLKDCGGPAGGLC